MKKIKVTEGDVVLVPTQSGEFGVAKVIYASSIYRNLVLLGVYKIVLPEIVTPAKLPDGFVGSCIYTGSQRIKTGEWPIVARIPVTEQEKNLSWRIVGGHVWLGDQCMRDATSADRQNLPTMDAWHCGVVVDRVEEVIASIRGGG